MHVPPEYNEQVARMMPWFSGNKVSHYSTTRRNTELLVHNHITEQRTRSVSSGLSKQLGHMPRIRSKQSIHQMGRFAHLSVTLLTKYFSLPLSPVRSNPSKEAVTNDQSRKGNLFDFFCLASIVVGYPSVRRRELALRSIIPKFKMNASSLLVMGYLAS